MTDQDIQNIYRTGETVSISAGLRAVFDAGYYEAIGQFAPNAAVIDASVAAPSPTTDVVITTV